MDFALSEEQTAIFDMAHAFGQDAIAPHARKWEAEGTIPKELWPQVGELGFGGLYVSEESGGAGLTLEPVAPFEVRDLQPMYRGIPFADAATSTGDLGGAIQFMVGRADGVGDAGRFFQQVRPADRPDEDEVAGENAWEELKVGAEKSWNELSKAFDKATSHLKK